MCRCLSDCSAAFKKDLQNAFKERRIDKAALYAMAGDKMGQELMKLRQQELTEKLTTEQEVTMEGNGQWLDKDEVTHLWRNKPQRLKAFRKNTRRWLDPLTETELVENVTDKSAAVSRTKRSLEESWKATVHDRVKKVHTPKPSAEGAVGADAAKPDEQSPKKPFGGDDGDHDDLGDDDNDDGDDHDARIMMVMMIMMIMIIILVHTCIYHLS